MEDEVVDVFVSIDTDVCKFLECLWMPEPSEGGQYEQQHAPYAELCNRNFETGCGVRGSCIKHRLPINLERIDDPSGVLFAKRSNNCSTF